MRENSATPTEISTDQLVGAGKLVDQRFFRINPEKGRVSDATQTALIGSDETPPTSLFMGSHEKGQVSDFATLAMPVGAEPDQWTDLGVREVFKIVGSVETGADPLGWPVVTVTAEQHRDGRLGVIDVDVDAQVGLSAAQARELAALLIAGATLAEEWVR
jgi:hypothetical protein